MNSDELGPIISRTAPRLLAVVFAAMIALFIATGFLTRFYNREKLERARRDFQAGEQLVKQKKYDQAIHLYGAALTLAANKGPYRQYLQALALALVDAGRTGEAEIYLSELLAADPSNGIANLMLARIYLKRGERDRAMQHYQRAIYGLWDQDPAGNRIKVRLELIGVLEQDDEYREMAAELYRLLEEMPDDPKLKKRVARLFLTAHSYQEAATLFTEITKSDRRDAAAWAGLGDAEFAMGHYLSARTAYREALRHNPEDLQSQHQYNLATGVINLDPMLRRLGSATRLRRSQMLISRALKALDYCLPKDEKTLPEATRKLLDQARRITAHELVQKSSTETVEENIALAESLAAYRKKNCGMPPVPDDALDLVLAKLAQ